MNRTEKAELVDAISTRLTQVPFVLLADYRGLSVPQVTELREQLRVRGAEYRVIKNTLLRRAIKGTEMEGMGDYLSGMTGVVLSGQDPIDTAKAVREYTKGLQKDQKFVVRGGWFDGDALDASAVVAVADLPSREDLLVMLLRTIQEGPRQVLGVMQAPARDLLYLLKNYESKLEEAAAG